MGCAGTGFRPHEPETGDDDRSFRSTFLVPRSQSGELRAQVGASLSKQREREWTRSCMSLANRNLKGTVLGEIKKAFKIIVHSALLLCHVGE